MVNNRNIPAYGTLIGIAGLLFATFLVPVSTAASGIRSTSDTD